MRQGLSQKLTETRLFVLDNLELAEAKTRLAASILDRFEVAGSALFLDGKFSEGTLRAFRNIPKVQCVSASECCALDVSNVRHLFVTKEAVDELVRRLKKQEVSFMKHLADIIKQAVFTERSTILSDKNNAYTFRVANNATKIDIKRAVEDAFEVKVKHVRTMVVSGRNVSRWSKRGWVSGRTVTWKKAIVTLEAGSSIDFV